MEGDELIFTVCNEKYAGNVFFCIAKYILLHFSRKNIMNEKPVTYEYRGLHKSRFKFSQKKKD